MGGITCRGKLFKGASYVKIYLGNSNFFAKKFLEARIILPRASLATLATACRTLDLNGENLNESVPHCVSYNVFNKYCKITELL